MALALTILSAPAAPSAAQDVAMQSIAAPPSPAFEGGAGHPGAQPAPAPAVDPMRIFEAIADEDADALRLALNAGADPNAALPLPVPEAFHQRFQTGPLEYYVRREEGFTPLMFAAALGDELAVRFLLAAGAEPNRLSRTNGTLALSVAAESGRIAMMRLLMGITPNSAPTQYRITVNLDDQRVVVWKGSTAIIHSPVSSGKKSTPTPKGVYLVTDKHRRWTSTLFHAKMPFFLRLSCGDFGLHAGQLPGYPASHGCIRLPAGKAEEIFSEVPVGTLVEID